MRAVVRGSLILMITAANLYKFKGRPRSPAEGFSWYHTTVHSFKNCHFQSSTQHAFALYKRLFTTLKLFSTPLGPGGLRLQSQDHCLGPHALLESFTETQSIPSKFLQSRPLARSVM